MDSPGSSRAHVGQTVSALLSDMSADRYGMFSPSVYETGRLVTITPSLAGHTRRVRFLLDEQHPDGSWGGPGEYSLVPTLSATEALLSTLSRTWNGNGSRLDYERAARSADHGLRALFDRLTAGRVPTLPDTVAVEIVVPGLIAEINAHLDQLDRAPDGALGGRYGGRRLVVPRGSNHELLGRLRDAVARGHNLAATLTHSLEVIGPAARDATFVQPEQDCVGCSPAATATWLGDPAVLAGIHPSVRYLEAVQDLAGGPVPMAAPLAVFERAWVLSALLGAPGEVTVPDSLVHSLRAELGELGSAGGPGMPPDADDTAAVLHVLARLGVGRPPTSLWAYESDGHFSCFSGERTPSTSTNAHVLQAFGSCLTPDLPDRARYVAAIDTVSRWLCEHQDADGSWWDKWHASPYYATACCATALAEHGGDFTTTAVRRAVEWVLGSQRADGSWGRWAGTYEETAYAVQILLRTGLPRADDAVERAAARGCAFLLSWDDARSHPPLWHDKDLYTPIRIVRAEGLAALRLAHADERVAQLIDRRGIEDSELSPELL